MTDETVGGAGRPFDQLTPDFVLDAIESLGLHADGRLLALNSYENRVYQIGIDDAAPLVAKFYRPQRWSDAQIGEEHRFALALADIDVPVVAPMPFNDVTLHAYREMRFALYPRRGGRNPPLEDPQVLRQLGRYLGRIHALGAVQPFRERPTLDPMTFGAEPRDFLTEHDWLPAELLQPWLGICNQALDACRAAFERAGLVASIRVHGDLHIGNLLWTDAGPHIVDLDDARMAPAVQDLWMLLSGDRDEMQSQLHELLEGYRQFADFDPRQLALIEPLRSLRLIHYSAWIARRWDDPAFPAAFPWFGSQRYWQDRILELREQVALMSEPALLAD